jgi:hypothetical protein
MAARLGSIDLTVLNGSGNYAYDWDDDQYDGQEDLSDLPLGTYCVTVTDLTTGCTISDCYTIEEENPLELEADVTGVSCDGGTLGSIRSDGDLYDMVRVIMNTIGMMINTMVRKT